jgi:hypothetical protein
MLIRSSNAANFGRILFYWAAFMVVITFLSGLVYITAQQVLRHSANDPQIQLAEDSAASLAQGKNPQAVLPSNQINMENSLAPYVIIFDEKGQPVASSAQLDGAIPVVPGGVFEYVRQAGEDRFTWQPKTGVRSAAIVTHFGGANPGFVLAGRSLREVEERENQLLKLVEVAWVGFLVFSAVSAGLIYLTTPRLSQTEQGS